MMAMKTIEKTIKVDAPIDVVFATWANYTSFPAITSHVIMAERVTNKHSHWLVDILGYRIQFEAELDQLTPNKFISWHSVTNIHHFGSVYFSQDSKYTQVILRLLFEIDNLTVDLVDDLDIAWNEFDGVFEDILDSFKKYVEQMWWQVPAVI